MILFQELRSKLLSSIRKNLSFCNLVALEKSPLKRCTLFSPKIKTLVKKLPSIIAYRYTSGNCKVSNYNKISISNIFNRAVRHMGSSYSCDKDVKSVRESAISDQFLLCNY